QDDFALRSQQRTAAAQANGRLAAEIGTGEIPQRKGDPIIVDQEEHPARTTLDALAKLRPIVRSDGTVTAGNASGVNDGAAAMIVATGAGAPRHRTARRGRV